MCVGLHLWTYAFIQAYDCTNTVDKHKWTQQASEIVYIPDANQNVSVRRPPRLLNWLTLLCQKDRLQLNPNHIEKMATQILPVSINFPWLGSQSRRTTLSLLSKGCITGSQSLESYVIGKQTGQCIPAHLLLTPGMISLQSAPLIKSSPAIMLPVLVTTRVLSSAPLWAELSLDATWEDDHPSSAGVQNRPYVCFNGDDYAQKTTELLCKDVRAFLLLVGLLHKQDTQHSNDQPTR